LSCSLIHSISIALPFLTFRKAAISIIGKNRLRFFGKSEIMLAMDPASKIIGLLGGEAKVAALTQTSFTAPYRWQHEKSKGGTGGLIPQTYHRTLLDYAAENGIDLKAEDFLPPRDEAQPAQAGAA
jgi:hypothetical protein